jgi:amino-acid N-acetyltransferase
MLTPELRHASARDIPKILRLIKKNSETILPRTTAELRQLLPTTWVVYVGTRLIGSVCLEVYSRKIAEVRSLVVAKRYRAKGIGAMLVNAAVEEAQRRKIHEVLAITSSREFFRKLNFGTCLHERYALFYNGKD